MINTQRLIDRFIQIVSINGQSGNEKEIAQYIKDFLSAKNIKWEEDNAGSAFGGNSGNIIAEVNASNEKPSIFFCAHMDTIRPTEGLTTLISDSTISSDGKTILGADDRAGVAILLELIEIISENELNTFPIKFIFTVAEEIGMHGSKNLTAEKLNSKWGVIFDSSAVPGSIIKSAPSAVKILIKVKGKAAHAALQPESGVNAFTIAANAIALTKVGRISKKSTLNFGIIKGGNAINIVPDYVEIEGEARSHDEAELETLINFVKYNFEENAKLYGGTVEFETCRKYYGFDLNEKSIVISTAKKAIERTGLSPILLTYPAGSDANIFNALDIPTVNLGVGFHNVHSHEEIMPIDNLINAAKIGYEIVLEALCKKKNIQYEFCENDPFPS